MVERHAATTPTHSFIPSRLPELFVVLARVLCWKDRRAGAIDDDESGHDHTESSFHIRLPSQSTLDNPVSDTEDASIDPEVQPAKKLVWDRLGELDSFCAHRLQAGSDLDLCPRCLV